VSSPRCGRYFLLPMLVSGAVRPRPGGVARVEQHARSAFRGVAPVARVPCAPYHLHRTEAGTRPGRRCNAERGGSSLPAPGGLLRVALLRFGPKNARRRGVRRGRPLCGRPPPVPARTTAPAPTPPLHRVGITDALWRSFTSGRPTIGPPPYRNPDPARGGPGSPFSLRWIGVKTSGKYCPKAHSARSAIYVADNDSRRSPHD